MEPSVKYGLTEEYLDCNTFGFVIPTATTPYAIVCLAASFQVSDLMVTEKWEGDPSKGEEGLYIIVRGLNVDYKINIRHKESKDGVTVEIIRNTKYLDINNTKEFIPTGDYQPATKKYVDDAKSIKFLTNAYGTASSWKADINSMEAGFDYKFPPDATKVVAISYRYTNSISGGVSTTNMMVFTNNSGKIPVIHMSEKVVDSKYVIMIGHEMKVQLDVVDNGDGTKTVTVTKTPLTLSISNTIEYEPTADYHPATKKYVDENKGLNHITGTEENPIILTDLDIGTYEIDGKLKTYPDSTSLKTVYNGLIVVERKDASISKGIYSYNGLIYSFAYTVSANVFIENKFVKDEEVLTRTNTTDFTPTNDYHPTTKKYVDSHQAILDFPGVDASSAGVNKGIFVDVENLQVNAFYKMPAGIQRILFRKNGEGNFEIRSGPYAFASIFCVQANNNTNTIIMEQGPVLVRNNINWTSRTLTTQVINVNLEYEPTQDYHTATKKYVDDAIANASLGNGSDVSDSGVIEDSEFDDLISGTFGPEYVNKEE
jgi:hypothetical protein